MGEMREKIVVFAPHPDDETLACGGTIAKKVREGEDVYIIFMTDGRESHLHRLGISTSPTPEELARVRKEEAKRAANILGVKQENLIFCDIEDRTLETNLEIAKEKVRQILLELRPNEVYFPDRNDLHTDHRATFTIVEDSISALQMLPKKYRYLIWSDEIENTESTENQMTVDIDGFLSLKKDAINEYQSQVTTLFEGQTRPVLPQAFVSNFQKPRERFISTG